MTCKISYFKTLKETLKHHFASTFSVCLVFFIQLIVFFLETQAVSIIQYQEGFDKTYITERLHNLTLPSIGYAVPIILIGMLLSFDFFRYLHSKKQMDFYESLPINRHTAFLTRCSCAFGVFLIPYLFCVILETLILVSFGFFTTTLLYNLLLNMVCMILSFLIVFLFGVLSMILTGHSIVALFGFCIFGVYAPILVRYIYPSYAGEFFDTFMKDQSNLFFLNYLSPIGLTYKLTHSYYDWQIKDHIFDFIAIVVMILIIGTACYFLFKKRPSEAAGRAMTFENWNSIIRILIVIPASLYIGLYLKQVSSMGSRIWMIFGYIIATVLVHGIIESVFRFDIRGLWAKKLQMVGCLVVSIFIAFIFWFDLWGYDRYLPDLDKIETITISCNGVETTTLNPDGIYGENIENAYKLAQNIIHQGHRLGDGENLEWIMFDYHLKNGSIRTRQYYMDFDSNKELFDKIFVTKDYKDDICRLYNESWDVITHITVSDGISEETLYLSPSEKEILFNTYIAEYTPITFSYIREFSSIGHFTLHSKEEEFSSFNCYLYPECTQTIAFLDKYLQANESTKDLGSLSISPLEKYTIQSVEIYCEDGTKIITDQETINSIKEDLIYTDDYGRKFNNIDYNKYYDASVYVTPEGFNCIYVIISKDVADKLNP